MPLISRCVNSTLMEPHAIVYDAGQYETKIGHAGTDLPSYVTYSQLLKNDKLHPLSTVPTKDMVLQEDCFLDHLTMGSEYLHLNISDHALMIPDMNEKRGKAMETLFEHVPALYFCVRPVLNTFQSGKTTALVVDIGHSKTTVCAVHDGYHIGKSLQSNDTAGLAINHAILKSLQDNYQYEPKPVLYNAPMSEDINDKIRQSLQMHTVHQFKEHCLVAQPYVPETSQAKPFEFPDKFSQVFRQEPHATDILFNPPTDIPLIKMIQRSVEACDVECRNLLASNVVLTGGTASIVGLQERLEVIVIHIGRDDEACSSERKD